MAGLGYKDFTAGAVLTAAQVDGYLMEQSVMNFAGTAARGSALASVLSAGQMAHVGGGTVTVYDGSAWQQVYPASAGLPFVAGTAFSAVSSVSINNCFSATYSNYRLIITCSQSADVALSVRFRSAGSDNSTAKYYYSERVLSSGNTASTNTGAAATAIDLYGANVDTGRSLDIYNPYASSFTIGVVEQVIAKSNSLLGVEGGIGFADTTSFDGFTLYPASGTVTGNIRIYGYRNS